ncbi:MAG: lipoate--protein ligase [Christensenellales bacterium]
MSNYVYIAPTGDGWMNLARDGYFLDTVKRGDVILYYYVNTNAVIIGRNQNAWKECNLSNMDRDGVQLVRRHTGGGAVYHDPGNLNFSFIMNERDYDLGRQLKVITDAVNALGVHAEVSGRNDILIDGRKFSGNAFGLAHGNRSHHGTILVNADLSKFGNYLNVSKAKIQSKGVSSVRSRVCNLTDFCPEANVELVRKLVTESFIREYGNASEYTFDGKDLADIESRYEVQKSWEWRLGKTPEFEYSIDHRFSFGEMQLHFNLKDGHIQMIKVYSDCLDTELCDKVTSALTGVKFTDSAMIDALMNLNCNEAKEIAEYIEANGL